MCMCVEHWFSNWRVFSLQSAYIEYQTLHTTNFIEWNVFFSNGKTQKYGFYLFLFIFYIKLNGFTGLFKTHRR